MPDRTHSRYPGRSRTRRKQQLRALRTGIILGLLSSALVALLVYGLHAVSKF